MTSSEAFEARLQQAKEASGKLKAEIGKVLVGQAAVVDQVLWAILAGGHALLEGAPGLGKTLLLSTLARVLGGSFSRIQFTPDLIPSDIVGTRIFRPSSEAFDVEPGPILANVVLVDEINRAPARVQSALLEAMAERQVTVGGRTFAMPRPFLVVATQNPVESEGVYPLAEAQRDRFLMRVAIGYPHADDELAILRTHGGADQVAALVPVTDAASVSEAIVAIRDVHVAESVAQYVVALCRATRSHPDVELGASPRASLALMRAARAVAAAGPGAPAGLRALLPALADLPGPQPVHPAGHAARARWVSHRRGDGGLHAGIRARRQRRSLCLG